MPVNTRFHRYFALATAGGSLDKKAHNTALPLCITIDIFAVLLFFFMFFVHSKHNIYNKGGGGEGGVLVLFYFWFFTGLCRIIILDF